MRQIPARRTPEKGSTSSVETPETGTRLSAGEIHDNVMSEADEELERATASLLISSFASGLAIGFSFLGGAYASSLVSPAYAPAAAAAAYPLGFMFVIMARSELFTENTLTPVLPLLHRRDAVTLVKMLRVWGLLLAGNLLGTLLFAWVLARTPAVAESLRPSLLGIAERATAPGLSAHALSGCVRRVAHCAPDVAPGVNPSDRRPAGAHLAGDRADRGVRVQALGGRIVGGVLPCLGRIRRLGPDGGLHCRGGHRECNRWGIARGDHQLRAGGD